MTKVDFKTSVLCAVRGLLKGIANERNIKIQLLLITLIISLSLILRISKIYLITIIIVCFLIIILELFNRGFEKLIDVISPDYNKELGKVKDAFAGVVLLTFIMAMLVSVLILFEPLMNLFKELIKYKGFICLLFLTTTLLLVEVLICYFKNKLVKA